jgi:hypothetical protein
MNAVSLARDRVPCRDLMFAYLKSARSERDVGIWQLETGSFAALKYAGEKIGHAAALGSDHRLARPWAPAQWLHEVRPDLGGLDAAFEILPVGSPLGRKIVLSRVAACRSKSLGCLAVCVAAVYAAAKMRGSIQGSIP